MSVNLVTRLDVQHEDRDSSSGDNHSTSFIRMCLLDDLDANIKKVVRYIWDDDEPEDEVICRRFNIPLTRYDLKTLKGTNWLNDQVIDFYLNLIVDRSKSRDDLPRVCCICIRAYESNFSDLCIQHVLPPDTAFAWLFQCSSMDQ